MNGILKGWRKDIKGESPKNIFEIHCAKDNL